jgi:hypothetical protein
MSPNRNYIVGATMIAILQYQDRNIICIVAVRHQIFPRLRGEGVVSVRKFTFIAVAMRSFFREKI